MSLNVCILIRRDCKVGCIGFPLIESELGCGEGFRPCAVGSASRALSDTGQSSFPVWQEQLSATAGSDPLEDL